MLINMQRTTCRYSVSIESEQFVPVDRIIQPPVNDLEINRYTFLSFSRTQILLPNALPGTPTIKIYYDIEQNLITNLLNNI